MLRRSLIYIINQNKRALWVLIFFIIPNFLYSYSEKVFSGVREITISGNISLIIASYYQNDCNREIDLCLPLNNLFLLINGAKYDSSNLIKYWNNDTFVYFVKISANKYFEDLDKDGNFEIAIYPMIAGNNPVTDAYIYSVVGNKLIHYGMGRFHYEWGPYVKEIVKGKWIEPL